MAIPKVFGRLANTQLAAQVLQHPQVVQRVQVAGDMQRQGTHPGALRRITGQQRRHGEDFLEVFENRQRLGDAYTAVAFIHQQGQQLLRI